MIKRIVAAFSPFLLAALLWGCANLPPKPASPDDCLVIFKSDFIRDADVNPEAQWSLVYKYKFSGDYPEAFVRTDYSLVVVREPAVEMKSVSSQVSSSMYCGPRSEYPIKNLLLPYKPGYLVVADYVFENKISHSGDRGFYSSWRLRPITEKERTDLLDLLRSDPAFASWKK